MTRNYKDAWQRQELLKQKYSHDEVPDINELVDIVENIYVDSAYHEYYTNRARALFVMYYLTGCRLSEILAFSKEIVSRTGKVTIIKKNGVKKRDIKFSTINDKLCMTIRIGNLKNKMKHTKKQPIPVELEKPLVKYLLTYLKMLKDEDLLFPFKKKRATQIINTTTGWNAHFIRHVRATHLVVKYDYNDQLLVKFMGWTSSLPAKHYMELSSKDMFRQFFYAKEGR